MTDGDALTRAILIHPREDTPRLVYADWLDETAAPDPGPVPCSTCRGLGYQRSLAASRVWTCPDCSGTGRVSGGRPGRAEFIRVQVELARLLVTRCPLHLDSAYPFAECYDLNCLRCRPIFNLRRRESELWAAAGYGTGWFRLPHGFVPTLGDPAGSSGPAARVRRGFVDEVRCTAAEWFAVADDVLSHPDPTKRCPVTRVTLTTWPGMNVGEDGVSGRSSAGRRDRRSRRVPPARESRAADVRVMLQEVWPGIEFTMPTEVRWRDARQANGE